jgi:hypothetical protein
MPLKPFPHKAFRHSRMPVSGSGGRKFESYRSDQIIDHRPPHWGPVSFSVTTKPARSPQVFNSYDNIAVLHSIGICRSRIGLVASLKAEPAEASCGLSYRLGGRVDNEWDNLYEFIPLSSAQAEESSLPRDWFAACGN